MVGLAAAHYRLGEYRDALAALSEAVDRRGALGDLAMPYALVAYRAQQPELSRLAFAAATGQAGEGAPFLDQAFARPAAWHPRTAEEASALHAPAGIGRALCRERVCPYVSIVVGAGSLKKI